MTTATKRRNSKAKAKGRKPVAKANTEATAAEEPEFKMPELPKVGEWLYWYHRDRTHLAPMPALATRDAAANGGCYLTIFTPGGPQVVSSVPHGSPLLQSADVREQGSWSWERLDEQAEG